MPENHKVLQQRTVNIIMCCKFHCHLLAKNTNYTPHNAVIAYLSHECVCPVGYYETHENVVRQIVLEALYDYLNCASNPGYVMRQILEDDPLTGESLDASLLTRIYHMFLSVDVISLPGDGITYINGFTKALCDQSDIDLSPEKYIKTAPQG